MARIAGVKTETNKTNKTRKPFISEQWLKEDNIGKEGFVVSHKNINLKFND